MAHFLDEKCVSLSRTNPWAKDSINRLRLFATGGKSVRGNLLIHIAHSYGAPVTEDLFSCAAAVELFHSGFLIHDDIMDNDRLRRGQDTLFVQYEKEASSTIAKISQFGQSMAICIADASFFLANELLSQLKDTEFTPRLLGKMSQEFTRVCLAQMQDVSFGLSTRVPEEEEILSMYRCKTARYTFSLPFTIGAIIAHVTEPEQSILEHLGEELGILFQIHDDMLNLFGDTKQTGKPVGSDLREQKKTLAYVSLYAAITKEERLQFQRLGQKPDDFMAYVYGLLAKYHIKELMQEKENRYAENAGRLITELSLPQREKNIMHDLIEFVRQRSN